MSNLERPYRTLRLGDQLYELGSRTIVMGIINCTPDSFFDGGSYMTADQAIRRYHQIVEEGADWIDVGGESSRPGSDPVRDDEEWKRVQPVIEAARKADHPIPLSIDTTKYEVARRALDAGAVIINDISALGFDTRLADLAVEYGAGLIVMHMRGTPATMQLEPVYDDVVREISDELTAAVSLAMDHNVSSEQLIVDPGIGFGKTVEHNLELIRRLPEFTVLHRPLLVGCSRKSLIGAVLDLPPDERLEGTLALHAAAALGGAHIVRVHDVKAHVRALSMIDAVMGKGNGPESSA
jgi:dihydropteroate synthase